MQKPGFLVHVTCISMYFYVFLCISCLVSAVYTGPNLENVGSVQMAMKGPKCHNV